MKLSTHRIIFTHPQTPTHCFVLNMAEIVAIEGKVIAKIYRNKDFLRKSYLHKLRQIKMKKLDFMPNLLKVLYYIFEGHLEKGYGNRLCNLHNNNKLDCLEVCTIHIKNFILI
jgi:hypothetical protein